MSKFTISMPPIIGRYAPWVAAIGLGAGVPTGLVQLQEHFNNVEAAKVTPVDNNAVGKSLGIAESQKKNWQASWEAAQFALTIEDIENWLQPIIKYGIESEELNERLNAAEREGLTPPNLRGWISEAREKKISTSDLAQWFKEKNKKDFDTWLVNVGVINPNLPKTQEEFQERTKAAKGLMRKEAFARGFITLRHLRELQQFEGGQNPLKATAKAIEASNRSTDQSLAKFLETRKEDMKKGTLHYGSFSERYSDLQNFQADQLLGNLFQIEEGIRQEENPNSEALTEKQQDQDNRDRLIHYDKIAIAAGHLAQDWREHNSKLSQQNLQAKN